ncbi:MAG: divalent-cation tolerance protein CutA [Leptospirales bacterium]
MTPVLVTTTVSSLEEGEKISRALVEARLAACVNILGPVQSIYRWKGEIQQEEEYKLIIKSFSDNWRDLELAIKGLHSYEIPEITMIAIKEVDPGYLNWMFEVTDKK